MNGRMMTGVALAALLIAAGCSRSVPTFGGGGGGGGGYGGYSSPAPLTPAPAGQVSGGQLPPPPPPPPPTQTAALEPQPGAPGASPDAAGGSGGPLSRNAVLGAYKVTTTGGNCQIILSLTKWTGGYRAASRGCPGNVADVTAWDVSGSQVVLKDSGGTTVANLSSAGGSRYEGTTSGGQTISLYR